MNALLDFKLSIISPKPQTTRHRILGILNGDDHQIIFLDTPGIIDTKYRLQETMMRHAWKAVDDADVILFLLEPGHEKKKSVSIILEKLEKSNKPIIVGINKIDLVEKKTLLPIINMLDANYKLAEIIPISGKENDGLDLLKSAMIKQLPAGMPFYPQDQITEQPERFFVSEIIREKIFSEFEQEIPYSTAVVIDEFKEVVDLISNSIKSEIKVIPVIRSEN